MKRHKIRKYLARVFVLTLFLQCIFSPILTVQAHDAVYIKTTIDDKTMSYNSELITDKHFWAMESGHMERRTGSFGNIKTEETNGDLNIIGNLFLNIDNLEKMRKDELPSAESVGEGIVSETKEFGKDGDIQTSAVGKGGMIFTFPAESEGIFGGVNNATSADVDRAFEVSNTLTSSLNNVLRIISEGTRFDTVEDLINTSIYIRPSKKVTTRNGTYYEAIVPNKFGRYFHIVYGTDYKYSKEKNNRITQNYNALIKNNRNATIAVSNLFDYFPQVDENGRLYAYIWETTQNPSQNVAIDKIRSFVWAMPKGYIAIDGINDGQPIIKNNYDFAKDFKTDTAFLTIHQLAFQANYSYKNLGMTTSVDVLREEADAITKLVLGFISKVFYGLRSLLGLYETQELIFNKGLRGSNLFTGGIMDRNWWGVVLRYHLIFQTISWVLISGAVVKMLIQMNLSTINPNVRISTMESFQKLLIVGFLLVSIIPLAQLFVSINTSIVDIFATQVDWSDSARIASHTGLIAGLLIEFVYFAISLYLNFVYIMRSIMIAILIASGPFFVVSMAFSVRGKGFFDGWSKELIANIFLQAFHAFAFSFMINIQSGTRGIEQLVTAMALIPLTEFFRGMIFGQSGSFAVSQGRTLANTAKNALVGATKAGVGAATNFVAKRIDPESNTSTDTSSMSSTESRNSSNLQQSISQTLEKRGKMIKDTNKATQNAGSGDLTVESKISNTLGAMMIGGSKVIGAMEKMAPAMDSAMNIASGAVFGDERAMQAGASSYIANYAKGVGGVVGTAGAPIAKGLSNVANKMAKPIANTEFAQKLGLGDNPFEGALEQKNGTVDYMYDSKKLSGNGIIFGQTQRVAGQNQTSVSLDLGMMSAESRDRALKLLSAASTDEGRQALAKEYGILDISADSSLKIDNDGNVLGKINMALGDEFMRRENITGIRNNGTKTVISKIQGAKSSTNVLPNIDDTFLSKTVKGFETMKKEGVSPDIIKQKIIDDAKVGARVLKTKDMQFNTF